MVWLVTVIGSLIGSTWAKPGSPATFEKPGIVAPIQAAIAVGQIEGHVVRRNGVDGDDDVFQGVHLEGLFPTQLVGQWRLDHPIPAYPVDQLGVEEVHVDGMGVDAVMGDLPKLGLIVLDELIGRVDIVEDDRRLDRGAGVGDLCSQDGVHTPIGQIEVFLDGLWQQTHGKCSTCGDDCHRCRLDSSGWRCDGHCWWSRNYIACSTVGYNKACDRGTG